MSHAFDVFLPITDKGQRFMLAIKTDASAELEQLGRDLWMGSRGIAEQGRLASCAGNRVPIMTQDGRFDSWAGGNWNSGVTLTLRLRSLPAFSQDSDADIFRGINSFMAGSNDPGFIGKLLATPLDIRMSGQIGMGSQDGRLLQTPLPTAADIFGGRSKASIPVLTGQGCADLMARHLAGIDLDTDHLDEALFFGDRYLYAQDRWLTIFQTADDDPIRIDGKKQRAVWIPVAQALALSNLIGSFDASDENHLRNWITPQDKDDLLAIGRSVPARLFFQGSGEALSWFEEHELASATAAAPAAKRPSL